VPGAELPDESIPGELVRKLDGLAANWRVRETEGIADAAGRAVAYEHAAALIRQTFVLAPGEGVAVTCRDCSATATLTFVDVTRVPVLADELVGWTFAPARCPRCSIAARATG